VTQQARQAALARVAADPSALGLDRVHTRRVEPDEWLLTVFFVEGGLGQPRAPADLQLRQVHVRPLGSLVELPLHDLRGPLAGRFQVVLTLGDDLLEVLPTRDLELLLTDVAGLDPDLSSATFTVRTQAIHEGEERPARPSVEQPDPTIDYLTRDFNGFRRLMLDRMSQLVPAWIERSAADEGVMLVEIVSYIADYLSYQQDAVAQEATLATATRRLSVRRHVRLLDQRVHDGCTARLVVDVPVYAALNVPAGTLLYVASTDQPESPEPLRWPPDPDDQILRGFETIHAETLRPEYNALPLHDPPARLSRGTVTVDVVGHHAALRRGKLLVLGERTPDAGADVSDALLLRAQAVRLAEDALLLTRPEDGAPFSRLRWSEEDALTGQMLSGRVRVLGNILLADYGRSSVVRLDPLASERTICLDLARLTVAAPLDLDARPMEPASRLLSPSAGRARPAVQLVELRPTTEEGQVIRIPWTRRDDLLACASWSRCFVAELDDEDMLVLRFGDGVRGARPAVGTVFELGFRLGTGPEGNVGVGSVQRIGIPGDDVIRVSNPLPGQGGAIAERVERVRASAPVAWQTPTRVVSAADWTAAARGLDGVADAVTKIVWQGPVADVQIHLLPTSGLPASELFLERCARALQRSAVAGYLLRVSAAVAIPLVIRMVVWCRPDRPSPVARAEIRAEILALFGPDVRPLGVPLYASEVVAAVMKVPTVARCAFEQLGRDEDRSAPRGAEAVHAAPYEILVLAPERPSGGTLQIDLRSAP